jgi:uroporphyrinogen-III synthase
VGVRDGLRVKIVVTRPTGQGDELVERLRGLGHDAVACPLIEVVPQGDDEIDVTPYDWVVVTSANAARELRRRMRGTPARVAAIGLATAAAYGGADLVPEVATQEGLLAEFPRPAGRVLFAGAAGARRLLADELAADVVVLYETRELRPLSFP